MRTNDGNAKEQKLEGVNESFKAIEEKLKRLNNMGTKLASFVKANKS
jgi:hypothetical protein